MRPYIALVLPIVAACGGVYWFFFKDRLHYPPPEVARLELARGDISSSGSCLSVDTVLRANGFTDNIWTSRVKNEWTMRIQNRGSSWRAYTFTVEGSQLVPVSVASSDDLPQITLEPAIDEWIAKVHSPPADSCKQAGR